MPGQFLVPVQGVERDDDVPAARRRGDQGRRLREQVRGREVLAPVAEPALQAGEAVPAVEQVGGDGTGDPLGCGRGVDGDTGGPAVQVAGTGDVDEVAQLAAAVTGQRQSGLDAFLQFAPVGPGSHRRVVAEEPLHCVALPVDRALRQHPAIDPDARLVQLLQGEEGAHVPESRRVHGVVTLLKSSRRVVTCRE
ncbi:hypothetical protein [Streptosporangium sp. NBC_01469]|uniref:hypothetical protein n=1 Tax=Streptosporangium sp. NBC_01469 TaxID=2903898 RepID=UPI002E2D3AB4|nr:hypothetical protein [Streptosporangium sp. NBC_01469]